MSFLYDMFFLIKFSYSLSFLQNLSQYSHFQYVTMCFLYVFLILLFYLQFLLVHFQLLLQQQMLFDFLQHLHVPALLILRRIIMLPLAISCPPLFKSPIRTTLPIYSSFTPDLIDVFIYLVFDIFCSISKILLIVDNPNSLLIYSKSKIIFSMISFFKSAKNNFLKISCSSIVNIFPKYFYNYSIIFIFIFILLNI